MYVSEKDWCCRARLSASHCDEIAGGFASPTFRAGSALVQVRGRRASRSDTRAASQDFERMHNTLSHRSKT
jgi:hypothetical protein